MACKAWTETSVSLIFFNSQYPTATLIFSAKTAAKNKMQFPAICATFLRYGSTRFTSFNFLRRIESVMRGSVVLAKSGFAIGSIAESRLSENLFRQDDGISTTCQLFFVTRGSGSFSIRTKAVRENRYMCMFATARARRSFGCARWCI